MRYAAMQQSPRSTSDGSRLPMGGLSQALTAAEPNKKRPLSHQPVFAREELPEPVQLPQNLSPRPRSALHHQLSVYQQKHQRLQSSGGSGISSVPLSPISTATPRSSGTTVISQLHAPLFTFNVGESDASDGEDFDADSESTVLGLPEESLPRYLHGSHSASASAVPSWHRQQRDPWPDVEPGPSWTVYRKDCPSNEVISAVHTLAAAAPVPCTMQRPALAASVPGDNHDINSASFRPGSVMEGAGRKLSGTEAMRVRNTVLRQTGFLEIHSNNMFGDHEGP